MKRNLEGFPEIIKEWHPTKNGNIQPLDLVGCSNNKYWFKCSKGHEWDALLSERISKKTGCPYCSNHKVCLDNCLQTCNPEISEEWHPTMNGLNNPKNILSRSAKKVWWLCKKKGHIWQARVCNRTTNLTNCPYCYNQKVCEDNCLQTLFPNVALEWDFEKNGSITPNDVLAGSKKRYWWKCLKHGHCWESSVTDRTRIKKERNPLRKNTCPFCSGKKVSKENSLSTLFPEIAREWHPTKNGTVTPNDVVAGSHKRYWFKCSKGHEWSTNLNNRTGGIKNKTRCGCPYCLYKTQEKVREIFERLLIHKFPKLKPSFLERLEYDGANEDLKLAFEYDGEFHDIPHYKITDPEEFLKRVKRLDSKKDRLSLENGWTLIRIHHSNQNRLEEVITAELKKINLL